MDEFSTCSLRHLAKIAQHVHVVRANLDPNTTAQPAGIFADLHALFVGDPRQLEQPNQPPIYAGAAREDLQLQHTVNLQLAAQLHQVPTPLAPQLPAMAPSVQDHLKDLQTPSGPTIALGRRLWRSIPYAFVLTKQHRGLDTARGHQLYDAAETFAGIEEHSRSDVERVAQLYNTHAVSSLSDFTEPYVVVLRHSVRVPILQRLLPYHALHHKQQLLLWRSVDLAPDGSQLPPAYIEDLEVLGGPDNDGAIPAIGSFFPGIRDTFTTNAHPSVHHVHNNTATGVGIVLHPFEPTLPDPAVSPIHVLTYVPQAIVVRPDGGPLPQVAVARELDSNYIIVTPKSKTFTPKQASTPQALHRFGLPLDLNYAETDYFVEGQTFRGQTWLVHLARPPTGQWHRASMYVIPTRFPSLDELHLLAPMWPAGDDAERQHVLKRLTDMAKPVPDLRAEWQRLTTLSDFTLKVLPQLLERISRAAPGLQASGAFTSFLSALYHRCSSETPQLKSGRGVVGAAFKGFEDARRGNILRLALCCVR